MVPALCLAVLLAACSLAHGADPNVQDAQAKALEQINLYVTPQGSSSGLGWPMNEADITDGGCTLAGVACNNDGEVTSISVAGQQLSGSLPDGIWSSLPALETLNFANTGIGGSIPATLPSAAALKTVDLSGNTLEGAVPTFPSGVSVNVANNPKLAVDGAAPSTSPSPDDVADASPSPSDVPASPSPSDMPASPSPATVPPSPGSTASPPSPGPSSPAQSPATSPAASSPAAPRSPAAIAQASPKPHAPIGNAPICSCALRGFNSADCQAAFNAQCSGAAPPPADVCNAAGVAGDDANAAKSVAGYLQNECFPNQGIPDGGACACAQNLDSNDCAAGRVALCVKGDPLCLPFQQPTSVSNAGKISSWLDANCPVPTPSSPGVKVGMVFPGVDMATYVTQSYTQNVANALASVANVPSSAISLMDVRPTTNGGSTRRRSLLQPSLSTSGTYFVASADPMGTLNTLQQAANDGTLTKALNNNYITGTPTITLQAYTDDTSSSSSSSGLSTGAIVGIVIGCVAGMALLGLLLWCCCRRRNRSKTDATAAKGRAPASQPQLPTSVKAESANPYATNGSTAPYPQQPYVQQTQAVQLASKEPEQVNGKSVRADSSRYSAGATTGAAAVGVAAAAGATLVPWERAEAQRAEATPVPVATTPTPLPPPVRTSSRSASGTLPAAGVPAAPDALGAAPVATAPEDPAWRTNVRGSATSGGSSTTIGGAAAAGTALAGATAAASAGSAVSGTSSMTAPRSAQQAERAKFWAQFQETWQQVRETKKITHEEPGTPSSGTNWTETDAGTPPAPRR